MSESNEKDQRSTEGAVPVESEAGEAKTERQISFTRRALVHAGWAVPVVLAVRPPVAFAQSPGGTHTDEGGHGDTVFSDTTPGFTDVGPPHTDNVVPHVDA
jgi:hypothetical protein